MNAIQWVMSLVITTERPEKVQPVVRGKMPEDEKELRERFLSRPDDKDEKLTHFQERMQSGGG